MLKREEILACVTLKQEVVEMPEWGGNVKVSEMSGAMRDDWERSLRDRDSSGKFISPRARLVMFTVVDDQGDRLFQDGDIPAIGKLSSEALERICLVAMKLNGLGNGDVEAAKKN